MPMRDGARLKADVFRPYGDGKFPAILNLGPYQKDKLWIVPDTLGEAPNDWMNWETVNPQWWVPRGYAAVRVDGRGSGKSPGQCEPWSLAEAVDFYDAIEWAAAQPWCNGNVGLSGISYYRDQPMVRRQSAAAVVEGDRSLGRLCRSLSRRAVSRRHPQPVHDQLVHGASAASRARARLAAAAGRLADQHAVFLAAQQSRQRRLSRLAGAMGQDHGADVFGRQLVGHGRCICAAIPKPSCGRRRRTRNCASISARMCIRSTPRKARHDQIRFLDYWLKGIDNGVMDEPPVKLAIRKGADAFEWREEHEWPLKRTRWTKLYLDLSQPQAAGARYDRHAGSEKSAADRFAQLSRVEPRLDGLDLGRLVAGAGRRHQAGDGRFARDRAACRSIPRSPGRSPPCSGYRARARTWICS